LWRGQLCVPRPGCGVGRVQLDADFAREFRSPIMCRGGRMSPLDSGGWRRFVFGDKKVIFRRTKPISRLVTLNWKNGKANSSALLKTERGPFDSMAFQIVYCFS
jgi:hypothetical protein